VEGDVADGSVATAALVASVAAAVHTLIWRHRRRRT